jgi:glycosyltransferase involved in cell wall biosynthesis
MEFMSQGVPVVVSRTKIDAFYFGEDVVHFFRSGDSHAMAEAMLDVVNNPDLRKSLVIQGYEYVERNSWNRKKQDYLDLIDSLSTERFDGIRPVLSAASPTQKNHNSKPSTGSGH